MTDQFFTLFTARLTELVQDLRYQHKPTGMLIAPQIINLQLPRPTGPVDEGEEYPFVRWLVYQGKFARQGPVSFSVAVDGGIYAEDAAAGVEGISSLCMALGRIMQVPAFELYRLLQVDFTIGEEGGRDGKTGGLQAHPYYHCRLTMEFRIPGLP